MADNKEDTKQKVKLKFAKEAEEVIIDKEKIGKITNIKTKVKTKK